MTDLQDKIQQTASYIQEKGVADVAFGLILGSGLGELAEEIENPVVIPYNEIPHFPVSTVVGHAGQLVYGKLSGKNVLAMQGRFHYYEGNPMDTVTYPVRVMAALGIHSVVVTNAAGGVNEGFQPGNLMLITDHINFMGTNPLIGPNDENMGPRFPDMSAAYTKEYQEKAREVANKLAIDLQEGVYMARTMGADAVGMSTVPEVIVAAHSGLKVLGISCITNLAAGMQANLNHAEVVETTERVKEDFKKLIKETLAVL